MKIILFGSNGMLGNYVNIVLRNDFNIMCINRDKFNVVTDEWKKLTTMMSTFDLDVKDTIINCTGVIPQKYDHNSYKDYIRVNSLFPHKLEEISKLYNCKFIHVTTDCVFSGTNGLYNLCSEHDADNIYAISKSVGEPELSTVIRTSIIGEESKDKKSLLEWIVNNKNKSIDGFTNHYWNGVTCLTLAKIIKKIIKNKLFWNGVKHIHSPNVVTKYDLCCYINEIYNLNIKINPIKNEIEKNMTLSGENLFTISDVKSQLIEQYKFNK
jgi:dTDP-4-dehydrorhamnose reductase